MSEARQMLEKLVDVVNILLCNLPDSSHGGDDHWRWAWNELDSDSQDAVKKAREEAEAEIAVAAALAVLSKEEKRD